MSPQSTAFGSHWIQNFVKVVEDLCTYNVLILSLAVILIFDVFVDYVMCRFLPGLTRNQLTTLCSSFLFEKKIWTRQGAWRMPVQSAK